VYLRFYLCIVCFGLTAYTPTCTYTQFLSKQVEALFSRLVELDRHLCCWDLCRGPSVQIVSRSQCSTVYFYIFISVRIPLHHLQSSSSRVCLVLHAPNHCRCSSFSSQPRRVHPNYSANEHIHTRVHSFTHMHACLHPRKPINTRLVRLIKMVRLFKKLRSLRILLTALSSSIVSFNRVRACVCTHVCDIFIMCIFVCLCLCLCGCNRTDTNTDTHIYNEHVAHTCSCASVSVSMSVPVYMCLWSLFLTLSLFEFMRMCACMCACVSVCICDACVYICDGRCPSCIRS